MGYKETASFYIENSVDLTGLGWEAPIDWDELSEEKKEELAEEGFDEDATWATYMDIERLDVESAAIYDASSFDMEEARMLMENLIKPANRYLVMAHNCRWDGASGYRMCTDVLDAITRDYDVHIVPKAVSVGGKVLVCTESSHDVPTGARTSIIALTDKEADRLANSDFEAIEQFANAYEKAAFATRG